MQNFRKKMKNNKGFSLVELIIVIAILAILVGILAPQYIKYVEKSRKSSDASNIESFIGAAKVAAADTEYTENLLDKSYVVTMSTTGTEVSVGSTGTDGNKADLDAAFTEAVGTKWKTTKAKSKSWGASITAEIAISSEGSVTVTYGPDTFKAFMEGATETPAP